MDLLASIGHRCHDDTAVTIARATDLCDLLRMGRRPEAYLAPPEVRELRELVRHRAKLVALRSGLKAQVTRPGQFAAAADRGGRLRGRAGHQSAPGAAGPPPRLPDGADPARGRSDPGRWRCEAAYRMDLAPPTAGTRIRPAYSAPSRQTSGGRPCRARVAMRLYATPGLTSGRSRRTCLHPIPIVGDEEPVYR